MDKDKKQKVAKAKSTEPSFKRTADPEIIKKLVKEKLFKTELKVETKSLKDKFARIDSFEDSGMVVRFKDFIPPIGPILLTGFINQYYTEVALEVEKPLQSHTYQCKANYIRIASMKRVDARLPINGDQEVYVNYIKISNPDLSFKGGKVPVSYKILFEKYEDENKHLGNKLKITPFEETDKKTIYDSVFKSGKAIFVLNANDPDSFDEHKDNPDILNLKEYFDQGFATEQAKMVKEKKIGWIVSPINISLKEDQSMPIGYIEVTSKEPIEVYKFMEVQALSLKIVEKLHDMNILEFKDKQRILDISRGGLCIEFKNEKLIEFILLRRYFIFDIIIRMQAPITFQGWVRFTKTMEDGSMHCGIKIQGETSRPDHMKRYLGFLRQLAQKQARAESK